MIFYFLFSILLNGSYAQDIFGPLVADPKPDRITRDTHYLKSNEYHHDIYKDYIEDLGGIFMGVGTDQLYVMAGWCKPEILIPFDFDQYVVDIHFVYGIIFTKAKDPEEFIQLWQEDKMEEIETDITAQYPEQAKQIIKVYRYGRRRVHRRLKEVKKLYSEKKKVPIFLTDVAMYTYISNLFKNNKVFPVRGDLTEGTAMASIAKEAREANIPVRVIYMSNAEDYFSYKTQYRENFYQMYFDEKSVILRTQAISKTDYRYYIQSSSNFISWLKHPKTRSVRSMFNTRTKIPNKEGGYLLDKDPPEVD
jgi:hypothetical protein